MDLDLDLVRRVRPAVERRTRRTPLRLSSVLSTRAGTRVGLKLECEQVTGAFKVRGGTRDARPRREPAPLGHGLGGKSWTRCRLRLP